VLVALIIAVFDILPIVGTGMVMLPGQSSNSSPAT
jgi:hypothetical protein